MMTYEQAMQAILANPEDDAPRVELARVLRDSDPVRARYIERRLEAAKRRRDERVVEWTSDDSDPNDRMRWARDLDMFMGERSAHRQTDFDRGLPWLMSMNPHLFLEQGQYVTTRVAPIRGIAFFPDPEGSPFPVSELAGSSLCSRLDKISFQNCGLSDEDIEAFAASSHLSRCYMLDLRGNELSSRSVKALAAGAGTRKCLLIEFGDSLRGANAPGEVVTSDSWSSYAWEMSDLGHELERQFGCIPWLHLGNSCHPADAAYFVEHRILPRYEVGSEATAPTPRGPGLRSYKPLELRPRAGLEEWLKYRTS